MTSDSETTPHKKQHYVPRFYLRNFSNTENQTHLHLFHITDQKIIQNAPLRDQTYEKYFYGKDGKLEGLLGAVEEKASIIIRELIDHNGQINIPVGKYLTLLLFTFIQGARTRQAATQFQELITNTFMTIFGQDPHVNPDTFRLKTPASNTIVPIIKQFDMLADLGLKLLQNNTTIPLLTSDDPVIKYNSFLAKRKQHINTGNAVKGLQVILPISPNLALYFYDRKVYKVRGKRNFIVPLETSSDIDLLNQFQILQSDNLIFFSDIKHGDYVQRLFAEISSQQSHQLLPKAISKETIRNRFRKVKKGVFEYRNQKLVSKDLNINYNKLLDYLDAS